MVIPQSNKVFGQELAKAGPTVKTAELVSNATIIGAQATGAAANAMGKAVTKGIGTILDTIEEGQKAVENVRSKEFDSELRIGEKRARREIEEEEQLFVKENGRLFTPEETQQKYETKVNDLGNSLKQKYNFFYRADDVNTFHSNFVQANYEDYKSTVVHGKAVDATAVSLTNTFNNNVKEAEEAYSRGDINGVFQAIGGAEQTLNDPSWVIVKGGAAKHAVWKQEQQDKLRDNAVKFLSPEQRIQLFTEWKKDPIAVLATAPGEFFKDFIGSKDFEQRVIADVEFIKQKANQARVEQERVWSDNTIKYTVGISDAETQSLILNKPFDYNKHRDSLNTALKNGEIGPKQYAQALEKVNNSMERITARNASAEDRALRRADIIERRRSADYQKYGAFFDATQGIKPNIEDKNQATQLERAWVDYVGPAMAKAKTPEERTTIARESIKATGYVPRQILNQAADDLSSSDKDRVAKGIASLRPLVEFEPTVISRLPESARVAYEVGAITGSSERAAAIATNYGNVDPALRKDMVSKRLPEALKAHSGLTSTTASVERELKNKLKYELPPSAISEATQSLNAYYVNSRGNLEAAMKMMVDDVSKKYKPTMVDGRPRYLAVTPEKVLGIDPQGPQSRVLQQMWKGYLNQAGIPEADHGKYLIGNDAATLDPEDPSKVAFRVEKMSEDGVTRYPAFIAAPDGRQVPFRVMFTREEMVEAQLNAGRVERNDYGNRLPPKEERRRMTPWSTGAK